ncbi:hypothetical protein LXL04_000910 [Taraxacum kok-saghyz]
MQATMSHTPRQLTPLASNKPKKRDESFDFMKPSTMIPRLAKPLIPRHMPPHKAAANVHRAPADNKLLAGYMAHEFLTKGTLFGQPWDPARAGSMLVSADLKKPVKQPTKGKIAEPDLKPKPGEKRKLENYAEVSALLKGKNGAHIPGIVNPTQLAQYLHLQ